MKVNGDKTAIQLDAYLKNVQSQRTQAHDNQKKTSGQVQIDSVELSGKALAMQQGAHEFHRAEASITKRVEQVKMQIDKGTYRVDGAKVAMDMLSESFENSQVLNKIDVHV